MSRSDAMLSCARTESRAGLSNMLGEKRPSITLLPMIYLRPQSLRQLVAAVEKPVIGTIGSILVAGHDPLYIRLVCSPLTWNNPIRV